jgi:glycosyltransferase involved in cell wall biosynthesis
VRKEDTVVSKEDTIEAHEDRTTLVAADGSTLRGGDSALLVEEEAVVDTVGPAPAGEAGEKRSVSTSEEKVLILVQAFNEAGHVGAVVADVRHTLPAADVLVIDDGSEDATPAEAAKAGALVLSLPANCGYGTALQTGYKYAVRHGYELVGQIDADGQHQAEFLSSMLAMLHEDQADVVVGSRFLANDGHYETPFARSLGIRLFARLASVATGHLVTDPTSGFQVMRADIARLFSRDVFPVDYPDADILILLHRTGYRVRELPVQMRPSPGRSMHSSQSTPYYIYKMLLSIFVTLLRPRARGTP